MLAGKHTKYFERNLALLPGAYTPYDSSRTSLVYFCIAGLKLTGALDSISPETRTNWINWTYSNLVQSGNGFRGSSSHNLGVSSPLNDPANLASTFLCLSILALLEDSSMPHKLDRAKIMAYVKSCQAPNGRFSGTSDESQPFGDNDLRFTYIAAAIWRILGRPEASEAPLFDVASVETYIRATKAYDGGLGDKPGSESHAGMVFCGLAALKLLNRLDPHEWKDTAGWLSKRQLTSLDTDTSDSWEPWEQGGFNGRGNKPADTCYSFWVFASLELVDARAAVDHDMAKTFLLDHCQHPVMGGMVKVKGNPPDPLHSYLGLAALALLHQDGMPRFDAALTLPVSTVAFIDGLVWS